jgi:alkanesulfonate monooxygenase SsuD/methylene tetrahydromethanopterin reductase-like flavin-dependent oxidoreductase (luciferase family)
MAVLSEHHATTDGHLPSPLVLASAIAARTSVLNILIAAAVIPLYHPVRLAEDMTVLDNLSNGRVHYVFGIGHRTEEYEHMGVDIRRRGQIADESLDLLLRLLTGDPVDIDGRRIHVTPAPTTKGGPRILIGGGMPPDLAWPYLERASVTSLTAGCRQLLLTPLWREGPVQPGGCCVQRARLLGLCDRSVGTRILLG